MTRCVRSIDEVVVVVPANNEELLIADCLTSIARASERARSKLGVTCRVVVVLDSCSDGTAAIVSGYGFVEVVEVSRRNVGAARQIGAAVAIESSDVAPARLWIANTDADSTVSPDWIVHQLGFADAAIDLVIGSVFPVGDELTAAQVDAWIEQETADPSELHVHGANLGVRAETYLSVGGFDAHPEHEDVIFVERVIASGARVTATDGSPVATSARRHGRTPGGFAAHLRDNF